MRRVLIYGAGAAGEMVLSEIRRRPEEQIDILGFMDDDVAKHGNIILQVPVLGGKEQLQKHIRAFDVTEIIIAMPSIAKSSIRDIVRTCKKERVKLLIVPSTREIIEGVVRYEQIKNIHPADLLEREEIGIESEKILGLIRGRSVLVTGAAGSIGSELVKKILSFEPGRIVLIDINENGLFYLLQSIGEEYPNNRVPVIARVSDIKSRLLLREIFEEHRPDIVFHAAAYKHVPIMEDNIRMIFLNNVIGTAKLLRCVQDYGAKRFIGISTDKAVSPVSAMGKTKRICELLVKCYADRGVRASSVRFGNVLGSNGSVVTVFKRQIEHGGPVTITSPDMERYFMTIDEAVSLVLQAATLEGAGDIHVLEMGSPIRIRDLAESLLILSGYTPDVDMQIEYTGMRAGEKLTEELFHRAAEVTESSYSGIYIEKCTAECDLVLNRVAHVEKVMHRLKDQELKKVMDDVISVSTPARKTIDK